MEPAAVFEHYARGWRRVNRAKLRQALLDSELCQPVSPDSDVDYLFDTYDAALRDIADRLAPLHIIRRRRGRLAPWFDNEFRSMRREYCRLERQYRRTYTADDCRRLWVDATRRRHQAYRSKKELYWLERVNACQGSSFQLWRSLSTLLGRDRDVTSNTGHSADRFAAFFVRKIDDIRAATDGISPTPIASQASTSLSSFRPCTPAEVRRIIMASRA